MVKKLDGVLVRDQIISEIKKEINGFKRKPALAIIQVGENKASDTYIRNKQKACREAGVQVIHYKLDESATQEMVINVVNGASFHENIDGVIVQLPLPAHINPTAIERQIPPTKDVDGFSVKNRGMLFDNTQVLDACTPAGAIELLKRNGIELAGKNCVIVNRSNIIGKPLMHMLLAEDASVSVFHSKSDEHNKMMSILSADIVFLGIGKAGAFYPFHFKNGAVVVDFSINFNEYGKLCGDLETYNKESLESLGAYTPVPGGCGPMTIAMLVKNVLKAYKQREGIK